MLNPPPHFAAARIPNCRGSRIFGFLILPLLAFLNVEVQGCFGFLILLLLAFLTVELRGYFQFFALFGPF